jgi:hypothetical protein
MTIGEWIDHAIKADAANRGVAPPMEMQPHPPGAGPRQAPRDGVNADTAEAIFSRIADGERLFEARLRPIGYALKDVAERLVELEREAAQLPPPGGPSVPAPGSETDAAGQRPQPIQLRPVALGPPATGAADSSGTPADTENGRSGLGVTGSLSLSPDHAWTNVPRPAEPASVPSPERPDTIEFRPDAEESLVVPPAEPPETEGSQARADVQAAAEAFEPSGPALELPPPGLDAPPRPVERRDPERQGRPSVPPLPDAPPATWQPAEEINMAALSREAEEVGHRPPTRPIPAEPPSAETHATDTPETETADRLDARPAVPEPRPEPIPPVEDFPAEPIDTRALGLSGEPMEDPVPPLREPPGRPARLARLAAAAVILLGLFGGATWLAYRNGTLSLTAIEDRLGEAERSLSAALATATTWVTVQVEGLTGSGRAPAVPPTEMATAPEPDTDESLPTPAAPAAGPEPAQPEPAPQDSMTQDPPSQEPTAPETAPLETTAQEATVPELTAPELAIVPEPAAPEAVPETPVEPSAPAAAPPLPENPIVVDPRPVAPPPAPALAERSPAGPAADPDPSPSALSRAEAGHPAAQFEVAAGMMRAAPAQPSEAATWFRESAINGLDVAQFNLGVMYEQGVGVPVDETRALLWYHSAAEQGHPLAQYNLGRLYALGKGIPQSDAEARRWFDRAAARGSAAALHGLAALQPDLTEREGMMRQAAKAGDPTAQAWLRARSAGADGTAEIGPAAGLVLEPPSGAPDISAIQRGLARLGYYEGPIDGIAGPVTRAAIARFQSDNDLPATGLPSRSLRQRLN